MDHNNESSLHLPFTRKLNIKSQYNQENYNIFIRVPNDYATCGKHYPIAVVLDPNFLFSSLYGINSVAQNYIICGIGHDNVDFCAFSLNEKRATSEIARARDFLPFKLDPNIFIETAPVDLTNRTLSESGRADDFILFIKNQVMPFLQSNFRANNSSTIVGHSFGGVFVSFVLLKFPEIFNNYIAISPILDPRFYTQKDMFGSNAPKFETSSSKMNVYMALGSLENDDRTANYLQRLELECLKITRHAQVNGKFELIEGEDHVSVALSGMLRGFRFINEQVDGEKI